MNKVIEFLNNNLGKVRAIIINKEPWFVATDVLQVLGYSQNSRITSVLQRLDNTEKGFSNIKTSGGTQTVTTVNESGLYYLICTSSMPKAKEFRLWVTGTVLPSIRKNGGYISGQERLKKSQKAILEKTIAEISQKVDELTRANETLFEKNQKLEDEKTELEEQMTARLYDDDNENSIKIKTDDGVILSEREYLAYYG
jgi:prophage antirepressor-like protein